MLARTDAVLGELVVKGLARQAEHACGRPDVALLRSQSFTDQLSLIGGDLIRQRQAIHIREGFLFRPTQGDLLGEV